jgi:hypothetical protein
MTADLCTTPRAAPPFLFLCQELFNAMLFDKVEVFYHAHVILGSVPLVESFESSAGKTLALMAKPNKSLPEEIAMLFHENTVLAAGQAAKAVLLAKPLVVEVMLHCQVADADAAVHSAGSYEILFHHRDSNHQYGAKCSLSAKS